MPSRIAHLLILIGFVLSCATVSGELKELDVQSFDVYPKSVELGSRRARLQLVVTGYVGKEAVDLTRKVEFKISNESVVRIKNGVAIPVADGEAEISARIGKQKTTIKAKVTGQSKPDPVRFKYETLAVLTKQGCNAGSCHGSPQGKGGFSLSLFAYDPEIDKLALVRGGFNRRTNAYDPDESLMLKKPMLRVPHVGGKKLSKTDAAYRILHQWIYEGTRDDKADAAECTKIVVHPSPMRILRISSGAEQQQLNVLAHFSDGSIRDVTSIAKYDTSHHEIARADANGLVTGYKRGQAAITVRYLEHLESVYFTVVRDIEGFTPANSKGDNYVDRLVNERLNLLQFKPSPKCSDSEFIRRVYLDLTGLLPPAHRARAFLRDQSEEKRVALIEELLASKEFARFQALRISDLLRVNPNVLKDGRARVFADWIGDAVQSNMPFNQMAHEIITASGDTLSVAPANYFAAIPSTEDVTEATAQVFMGSRIQCAKCHNHPFENWTQNDYYSIGAVFHRVKRDAGMISVAGKGEMRHPNSGQVMRPWGSDAQQEIAGSDARRGFADWLTRPGNRFFARVEVNRIWAHLMGRGIVEPIDDFRSSNPPSNVSLLDALAADFEAAPESDKSRSKLHAYDRKHIFRVICNSQAYQRSAATNELNKDDTELNSHARVRLLTAEQLQDAIGYVTGTTRHADEHSEAMTEARVELEELLATLKADRPNWESEQKKRLTAAAYWHGDWWSIDPVVAKDQKAAHETEFLPEQQMKSAGPVPRLNDQQLKWQRRLDWKQGKSQAYTVKRPAAVYVYHTIFANRPVRMRLDFIADDGMKVWHNGTKVFDRIQLLQDGKNFAEIDLTKGINHFLIKPTNGGGAYHFTWKAKQLNESTADKTNRVNLPGYAASILNKKPESRTNEEGRLLDDFYIQRDGRVPRLRERIENDGRFDYATQRPYPEQTDFLRAFGQPKRETTCACERSSEPTLDQALQLLNGSAVFKQVQKSVKRYRPMKNNEMIDELYLAAFSRFPSKQERQAMLAYIAKTNDRETAIRDLVWAVVNTQEFMFQH